MSERATSYSRVLSIRAGAPENAEALLALARRRAIDASVFEEFEPSFFHGEISNENWDAYYSRMGISTLKNFAKEAKQGRAVLSGHRTYQDPIGHSLTGEFFPAAGGGVARVESAFYVITTDDEKSRVAKMRAGVIPDLSVGFYEGQWICSICGRDMAQWFTDDYCPHYLGMLYPAGKEGGATELARATVENAHLAEYSPVWDGATPECMIAKARAMALDGRLDDRQRQLIQVRYRLALPDRERAWPGVGTRKASGKTTFPLSDRERAWDGDAARGRWADACGGMDDMDWTKFHGGFFWYDAEEPEMMGSHKLGFVDVVDDTPTAIWRGITAVAAALQGGRGGVDIPEDDTDAVKRRVAAYYSRAREEYEDDSIQPPWESEEERQMPEPENKAPDQRAAPDAAADLAALRARHDAALTRLRECGCPEQHREDPVGWAVAELTRLRPLADMGTRYRAQVLEATEKEGVRALGDRYNAETTKPWLEGLSIELLEQTRDQWKAMGDAALPGGRRTVDEPDREAPKETERELPAAAFAA